jgi:redox-sensitive bicupin YhaK (pirin superfamily)
MSSFDKDPEQICPFENSPCHHINIVIKPKDKDLGGFAVRRLLPNAQLRSVGPWVFFDHMGPAQFVANQEFKVRPHPHIGIATVTYLFEGEILHRDSLATEQLITPGAINLMIAGSGIVHSERQRPEIQQQARTLHGLQLWLCLPTEQEQMPPAFYHYPSDTIPSITIDGVKIRVLMGSAYGLQSPVYTVSETLYVEAFLLAGQRIVLPKSQEKAVYVVSGELAALDTLLESHSMAAFANSDESIALVAKVDSQIAIIGGAPLGKRFMEWNFVATSRESIEQAKADWQAGRFAKVLGDEEEFIPLPN